MQGSHGCGACGGCCFVSEQRFKVKVLHKDGCQLGFGASEGHVQTVHVQDKLRQERDSITCQELERLEKKKEKGGEREEEEEKCQARHRKQDSRNTTRRHHRRT